MTIQNKYQDYLRNPNLKPYGLIKDDHRTCTKCNKTKHYTEYTFFKGKHFTDMSSQCAECKRKRDRERRRNQSDERRLISLETAKRYRQTDKYKVRYCKGSSIVYFIKCHCCDKYITKRKKRNTRWFCSNTCKDKHIEGIENRKQKSYKPNRTIPCNQCNELFIAKTGHNKRCDECVVDNAKAARKAAKIRRNNRKKGVNGKVHRIWRKKVSAKTNYCCSICKIKTQRDDIYADNAGELDHIMPLSKGGTHTYDNVQLLCRACNQLKLDNIMNPGRGLPLTLFG